MNLQELRRFQRNLRRYPKRKSVFTCESRLSQIKKQNPNYTVKLFSKASAIRMNNFSFGHFEAKHFSVFPTSIRGLLFRYSCITEQGE